MHPSDDAGPAIEMPRYRSHKEVWALKVKSCSTVTADDKGQLVVKLSFHDAGYADTYVPAEFPAALAA